MLSARPRKELLGRLKEEERRVSGISHTKEQTIQLQVCTLRPDVDAFPA